MKNSKKWIAGLALALAAAVAWGAEKGTWDEGYRKAVEEAVQRAGEKIGSVSPWEGATVSILPIHGDEDGYVSELLKIALTDAGVACVQLEGDPVWDELGKLLAWDERSSDILDPATVRLITDRTMKSATVLLTGTVRETTSRTGRTGAVLTLHATDVATTVHAWGGVFGSGKAAGPLVERDFRMQTITETAVPLNVGLKVTAEKGAEMEADLLETWARGRLADSGFRVGSGKEDDVTLSIETRSELLDETPPYRAYAGSAKAVLSVQGSDARELGAKRVDARGAHGLLESEARRNLADALELQLADWMKLKLEPEARKFAASRVSVTLANPIETKEDYKAIDGIQKGLAGLDGVRSAQMVAQDKASGRVEFLVVYDRGLVPTTPLNALWAAHPELLEYVDE